MSYSEAAYKRQLRGLLPTGPAWQVAKNGPLDRVLQAIAVELARIDARAEVLITEADPRTTSELLPEFEKMLGLPDSCVTTAQTFEERRLAVVSKMTNLGGQSRQFFIDLAAALGFTITITEFRPYNCEMHCESPICDDAWAHAWQVNAPLNTIIEFTCESACEDPLQQWGNERLECVIRRHKPAHTTALFAYA